MSSEEQNQRVEIRYAVRQLARAVSSSSVRAAVRVRQWRQVLAGMLDGTLRLGSRTPVEQAPPWVTLEVVHGGFATGSFAAGGPLQDHEVSKLLAIAPTDGSLGRAALNRHYVDAAGRAELLLMLREGRFRIHVPEEGALLTAAWLTERGEVARAAKLLETITPFFDRLRFYPVPHARPLRTHAGVCLQTVAESVRVLRAKRPLESVERMREAVVVWAPLEDRAGALFLDTVEGTVPHRRTDAAGALVRRADGQPSVDGGWPCKRFPGDWMLRARALLDDYRAARADHARCGKPERRKENFAQLRRFLAVCVDDPTRLSGREVGMIRKIVAACVTRHGAPGSERLRTLRAEQLQHADLPPHSSIAALLAARLEVHAQDEGLAEVERSLGPLSGDEASKLGAPERLPLPKALADKALRCLEAPVETLVEKGLLTSSESLGRVLPTLTAQTRAAAIGDAELRRLYATSYLAFRRRRSLLLLDLQSQVRLDELPWIAAIEPWVGAAVESQQAARATLVRTSTLALVAFPYTLLPNKLIKELRALAVAAGEPLPLVEELAADIFAGKFSATYLRSAQLAARLLRGTLYERYYGLPFERMLALDDVQKSRKGPGVSPGFATACEQLARALDTTRGFSVARNGTIIEQAQILTTHNLATLFGALGLVDSLRPELPALARKTFEWICARQQMQIRDRQARLRNTKNTAYAWRQMLFYLSLVDRQHVDEFLAWSSLHLAGRRGDLPQRFEPVMAGLVAVARGASFDESGAHAASGGRRFLGWSVGPHWLLPEPTVGS